MGYGLGALFGGLARAAKPMLKSGAKALGKIALTSGVNLLDDVLAGKNVKEAARARALEGANVARMTAVQLAQSMPKQGKDGREHGQEGADPQPNAPLERERHHQPNAQLKRERHLY